MPKLNIFDRKGKKVGTYNVEPTDFAPRINKQLLHDAVVMYQANARQGSHETRSRGMVAGSTKKMYKQKGTGNARAGSKRSGIRRGGGHIHRIHNRDYGYRLPRKALQTATRMALASKVRDDELLVIGDRNVIGVVRAHGHFGAAADRAMLLDGLDEVLAATRMKLAHFRQHRTDHKLVEADGKDERELQGSLE